MIKNVEFKTPNNEVLQETNLARLYDDMSEKIVKESEDFEGRDSGWTLDEILRLEVRTNRYSPFRGSSSFIEVPKQIAETKAIINVINKKDSQCFMWSILAALYPNTSNPNKTSSYVPHLNKLNFDGISFPTPLNEVKNFPKMNDIGINIYSFEEDLKIFPLLISDIVYLFENFQKIRMQIYKLDPCWYFTTPAISWDAMLLHTKVAIELFTDYDMLLFIEKGVRGDISQCCNRYAIANNRYMSNFNPDDEIKYLMYLDANNLYGYAMSKYLPLKDFVWSDNNLTEQDILNLSDKSDVGYILEVHI
ncbi:DNA_pol_B_2 domain-containing protein [Trichonephila clavipes]|nr:DNA_pol_B_2 domain-containing protein [Trichonephila clavipes]